MGFFAELLGLRLLLDLREWRQLPPENDRYPVRWISYWDLRDGYRKARRTSSFGGDEYWSRARVEDMLTDMWYYSVGQTIGWWVRTGVIVWLVWRIVA